MPPGWDCFPRHSNHGPPVPSSRLPAQLAHCARSARYVNASRRRFSLMGQLSYGLGWRQAGRAIQARRSAGQGCPGKWAGNSGASGLCGGYAFRKPAPAQRRGIRGGWRVIRVCGQGPGGNVNAQISGPKHEGPLHLSCSFYFSLAACLGMLMSR